MSSLTQVKAVLCAASCSLSISSVYADSIPISLGGTTQYDAWLQADSILTVTQNSGFPAFPGNASWPSTIGSSATGSGDAYLTKKANGTGGGPYPAGSSIYYGGFSSDINNDGGTLAVVDVTPVSDLKNIVFQIEIGEAWTYDFYDKILPSLSYTTANGTHVVSGENAAQSGLIEKQYSGTIAMPSGDEDVYINTYLIQWDLSAVTETISDFEISWVGVQHAQLYELRLDQSDSYAPAFVTFVPEPASLVFIGAGALAVIRRRGLA